MLLSAFKCAGLICLAAGFVPLLSAQQSGAAGIPTSVVVTLEPKRDTAIAPIEPQDIVVNEGGSRRPVVGFQPVGNAPMQLAILIDDSAGTSFGTEISTVKSFINSLPANFEVAVGYMRNGTVQYTQKFTADHAAAANSVRLASGPGGADVSPYDSLTDAVKHWPATPAGTRKEVIMISSGLEALGGGFAPQNPYVNAGIESAQKAGVVVYAIYNPSVGHWGHTFWRTSWGQNFLSQMADESGGDAYNFIFGPAVSFQPFLQQIMEQFRHQYELTFDAKPTGKSGLEQVKITIPEKNASIAAPDRVFVHAGM